MELHTNIGEAGDGKMLRLVSTSIVLRGHVRTPSMAAPDGEDSRSKAHKVYKSCLLKMEHLQLDF